MSKFHLGWFMGPGVTIQGWNEPGFPQASMTGPSRRLFQDMVRAMERACFDLFIIEDSSTVPDNYGGSMDFYLKNAVMTPKFDPVALTGFLIAATIQDRHCADPDLHLLPAVPAGAACWLHLRPFQRRPHRLEHRHRHQRPRRAELRPARPARA